jgi:RsiW-degrading membrane proteinase PrsW (M82 family)
MPVLTGLVALLTQFLTGRQLAASATGTAGEAAPGTTTKAKRRQANRRVVVFISTLVLLNATYILLSIRTWAALLTVLVAAVVPAVTYSVLVMLLDRNEREPARILLGTFLWGALVAPIFALLLEIPADIALKQSLGSVAARLLTGIAVAPLAEEAAKGLALLLLFCFLPDEFDNVLDGVVYGSLIGIGFAMTENTIYYATAIAHGNFAEVFYLRGVLGGLAGHSAFTATTGAGLGYARETGSRFMKVFSPLLGLTLAVGQHFGWNLIGGAVVEAPFNLRLAHPYVTSFIIAWVYNSPAVGTLAAIVGLAWGREARILARELPEEVKEGIISPTEYATLSSVSARRKAEWQALVSGGPRRWYEVLEFHQIMTDLAFRKWHLEKGELPKRGQKDATEDEFRQRLRKLWQELAWPACGAALAPDVERIQYPGQPR